ncbi:MAG: hypothetical protein LBQ15_13530 [Clostridium sp.]|jgi:hypothetical protein|nr:hypothetical protein [Clostridium sp.]
MSLKKNAFRNGLWLLYLLAVGLLFTYTGIDTADRLGLKNRILALAATGGTAAALFGLLSGLRLLICRKPGAAAQITAQDGAETQEKRSKAAWECLLAAGILAAGFALRLLYWQYGQERWEEVSGSGVLYFETAMTGEDTPLPPVVHGATYFYLGLLRMFFRVLGNGRPVGVWLQVSLQLLACLFWYVSVRKMAGRISAVVLSGFFLFSYESVLKGFQASPDMLYLGIYGLGLLCVGLSWERGGDLPRFLVFLLGMAPGLACYLDVTGFTLLLASVGLATRKRLRGRGKLVPLLFSAGTALMFFLCLLTDSFVSARPLSGIWRAWRAIYASKGRDVSFWLSDGPEYAASGGTVIPLVMLLLLVTGIFSYWWRKKGENLSPWIMMALGLGCLKFFRIPTRYMEGGSLLYCFGAAMAGLAVAGVFHPQAGRLPETAARPAGSPAAELIEPRRSGKAAGKVEEKMEGKAEEKTEAIQYIENPLPVPKKHVKKTMDYAFEPEKDQLKYDLAIPDYDDFDL